MSPSPSHPARRACRTAAGLLMLLLGGACAAPVPAPAIVQQTVGEPLVLAGWFHTVMNGSARYYLIDRQGDSVELLLEDELLARAGREMTFDRHHVEVTGRWRSAARDSFSVEEIRRTVPGDDR